MPCFNSEKYVAEAVSSILDQTFSDFEFIIVDGGSTDGTPDLLSEFASADSAFVLYAVDSCSSGALNEGLADSVPKSSRKWMRGLVVPKFQSDRRQRCGRRRWGCGKAVRSRIT